MEPIKISENHRKSLLGLPLEALKKVFLAEGFSVLDAKRVFPWVHNKLATSFEVMSDVPAAVCSALPYSFSLDRPKCEILQKSVDGTEKALLKFSDGNCIETVFIPDDHRNTICVSCQVGCPIGCKFCNTGTQRFCRNLDSSEIMAQVIYWTERRKELFPDIIHPITNIVFMGMGEPLLNAQNIFSCLELLLNEKTYNFSRNKITVSTSGVLNGSLEDLAKFGVKLAVSLHASNDELRSSLMPINNKYKIAEVLKAARKYLKESNTTHITFEYLLLDGINDSPQNAAELAQLLKSFGPHCRVNLIRFNDWNEAKLRATSPEKANEFSRILLSKGIRAIIRKARGNDILAACGQLKSEETSRGEK